jgi:hypothetical protein
MTNVLEFISEPQKILGVLSLSKERGTVVGINAPILGRGTHLTGVDHIFFGDEVEIILKPYDATGHILDRNKLKLSDIHSVLPFTSVFENPFIKSLHHKNQVIF